MNIGDRVKLLNNVYENNSDREMAPGTKGYIKDIVLEKYIYVVLDKPVEGLREWTFIPSELEVIE